MSGWQGSRPGGTDARVWGRRGNEARIPQPRALRALGAVLVITAACDEFPGSEVIAVGQGPDPNTIEVTEVQCPGDRVTEVILEPAPGGDPQHDEVLWRITSEVGSTQESYVVGEVPPGFVQDVPLTQDLPTDQGLAAGIDTAMRLAP